MSNNCINCNNARQVGDLKRVDTVGCSLLIEGDISISDITGSSFYQGYVYCRRRVGDDTPPGEAPLGKGALVYGVICASCNTCRKWEPIS